MNTLVSCTSFVKEKFRKSEKEIEANKFVRKQTFKKKDDGTIYIDVF